MEGLPEDDKAACIAADKLSYRKHKPFVSLNGVRNDPASLAKVVNARSLAEDVDAGSLPRFCWYTPNIQNDGHSPPDATPAHRWSGVSFLSRWLRGFLEPLLADPCFMKGTLVVVPFDESILYELVFAYDLELNCLRTRGVNKKHILLLLPGQRSDDRITLCHHTLADWIRQCRRAGLVAQGRALYEQGGLNFYHLNETEQHRGRGRLPDLRPPGRCRRVQAPTDTKEGRPGIGSRSDPDRAPGMGGPSDVEDHS